MVWQRRLVNRAGLCLMPRRRPPAWSGSVSDLAAIRHPGSWWSPEAIHRALNHALGGQNRGLPDGGDRLYIDDDRVLDIDQVIRGVVAS
jgi:hypothetical protein